MSKDMQISPLEIKEIGIVQEVKQGIVKIKGLPSCIYGQLIKFSSELKGMIIEFNPKWALAVLFGDDYRIKVGDTVSSEDEALRIPVGEGFVGRVVNALGAPLDDKGEIPATDYYSVFRKAVGVMKRQPIGRPLLTGIKILDLMVPIGRGQRELIIGNRQTGKTSIALDTIINQKQTDVICIYCWIGGSYHTFEKNFDILLEHGALPYTIFVCAPAGSSTAEQYICPYTATTLGEYFMFKGKHVLVVFDDLTKHAWIYRQMSLLLERFPGREAYPGDIFFLHSQVMERAGQLKPELGGGTMTFFPIAETLQGDITGYIQSNLIAMTDGQIYLNSILFHEGFKPAIDLGLSVSRIGSKVQSAAIREVSEGLRYEYMRYRDLLRLTRLRTKLSPEAGHQLRRGEALQKLLTQESNHSVSIEEMIVLFYAFKRRILEVLDQDAVIRFKEEFFNYLLAKNPGLVEEIDRTKDLTSSIKAQLDQVLVEYFRESKR